MIDDKIRYLYENTSYTLESIANHIEGVSYRMVQSRIAKWYSEEIRRSRKKLMYRRSKLGTDNPMFGKIGHKHPNYKGSVSDGKGYILVIKPSWFTGRTGSKHIFEHHLVMCKHLNIPCIPDNMSVHHLDHNTTNKDINNLLLLPNSAHSKLHQLERVTTIRKE